MGLYVNVIPAKGVIAYHTSAGHGGIKNTVINTGFAFHHTGMVGKYVKDLKLNNLKAYAVLKDDIEVYLKEYKKNGMDIW